MRERRFFYIFVASDTVTVTLTFDL